MWDKLQSWQCKREGEQRLMLPYQWLIWRAIMVIQRKQDSIFFAVAVSGLTQMIDPLEELRVTA
jgi:hypothetical protein